MPDPHPPIPPARGGPRVVPASATLRVNERVRELRAAGRRVLHLAFGESRFPVHPALARALAEGAREGSYLPPLGTAELRAAVARYHGLRFGLEVDPSRVAVGPGSKALLFAIFLVLGDELLLPRPCWVTYAPQARILGKRVSWIPTHAGSGYAVEPEALRDAIRSRRRHGGRPEVLVLNSPGNPTGTMFPPGTVDALAELAREEELTLVSDEIYALTAHGEVPHLSFARPYPEGTVVTGGLSKHLSLGGWRVGTVILPAGPAGEALAAALGAVAGNVWSCVPGPIQRAALVAYSGDAEVEEYIDTCARMHGIRTRYLHDTLTAAGVPAPRPHGAFYVFPSFAPWGEALRARGIETDTALAEHLLERYEIASLPGSAFHAPPGLLSLRLSSSHLDASTDEEAAGLVEAFRSDPDPRRFIEVHHPELREAAARLSDLVAGLGDPSDELPAPAGSSPPTEDTEAQGDAAGGAPPGRGTGGVDA